MADKTNYLAQNAKSLFSLPKPGQVQGASTQRTSQPFIGPTQFIGPVQQKTTTQNTGAVRTPNLNSLLEGTKKNNVLEANAKKPNLKDYDDILAPVFSAYNQFQSQLTNQMNDPNTYADLEAGRQVAGNNLQTAQKNQEASLAGQQQMAGQQADQQVAEQRRQFDEMQRGLQANFGGTTGTGGFAAELAGRTTMGNIGNIRTGLQDTIRQINDAKVSLQNDVKDKLFQLDTELTTAKNTLKKDFMEKIQEISLRRGELEANKAREKMEAMRQYQALQADIEMRNKGFQQQLYTAYQTKFGELSKVEDQTIKTGTDYLNSQPNIQQQAGIETGGANNNIINVPTPDDPEGLGLPPITSQTSTPNVFQANPVDLSGYQNLRIQ